MGITAPRLVWCVFLLLGWPSGTAVGQPHELDLDGIVIRLPADAWRPIDVAEPFAERFEAAVLRPGEARPEILTIVRLPLQFTDRLRLTLTADEFVDFHYLHPVKVTCRIRLDRGSFWLESVRTLEVPAGSLLPVPWRMYQQPTDAELRALAAFYDREIKETRFRLRQMSGR